jgi:aspartyl-tRNA(Asn)/glutamyl-tRNA(Gln) amidotransferase subunit C
VPIGRAEVERAARLARLRLDDDAVEELVAELSRIVDYVAILEDVVGRVPGPLLAPADVIRPDTPTETLPRDSALANARRVRDGSFEVPGFLPDDGTESAS